MRLPLSKVYRAFPELDRFPDEDCARFVGFATLANRRSQIIVSVLSVAVFVGGAVLLWPSFGSRVYVIVDDVLATTDSKLGLWAVAGSILANLLIPAFAVLFIRDFWLRWVVRKQIGTTLCPCGYSLLGLESHSGVVVCPECGSPTILEHRGLTPEQILAGTRDPRPASE